MEKKGKGKGVLVNISPKIDIVNIDGLSHTMYFKYHPYISHAHPITLFYRGKFFHIQTNQMRICVQFTAEVLRMRIVCSVTTINSLRYSL